MADVQGNSEQQRGTRAHDAPVDSNPLTIGGRAQATTPTAVSTDGNAVHAWNDRTGARFVTGGVRTATGTIGVLNGVQAISTFGCATATVLLAGTWVATVSVQGSQDAGTTWNNIVLIQPQGGAVGQAVAVPGLYVVPCAAYDQVRVQAVAYTSGTVNVTWEAGFAPHAMYLACPVPAVNETVYQYTPSASNQTCQVKFAEINATASGDTTVVSAVTARKLRVLAATFVCSAAVNVAWKSSASNTKINAMAFATNGGMDVNRMPSGFFMETNSGEALILNLSTTANVRGSVSYIEV